MDSSAPGWARFGTTVSERQVAALAEIGRTMVSGVDYEQVLAAVIEKVGGLLDAESGGFMLFDEASGRLVLQKPAFGFDSDESINAYRVPLSGGGNAVTVFVSGQPYFTNDACGDERLLQRFVVMYGARRVLTVPLQIEGRSIGVFHALNKRGGDFTPQDVELLLLIAPQLAVIIQSAAMMRELRRHEQQLERIIEIHNALSRLVLGGRDRAELVTRLSELVDLPVGVAEVGGHLTSHLMPGGLEDRVLEALAGMEGHALVDLEPRRSRVGGQQLLCTPIAVGSELLGCLAAIGPPDRLDALAVRTFQQAALVFALEMVKGREVYEVERRLKAGAVESLLATESESEAAGLVRRLGLELGRPIRAGRLLLAPSEPRLRLSDRFWAQQAWLHRAFCGMLARAWPDAVAVARGEGIDLLLPEHDPGPPPRDEPLADLVRQLGQIAERGPARPVILGVGAPATTAAGLRRSFQEATTVVAGRALLGGRQVVHIEEMGVFRLLAQPAEAADVDGFVERVLGPLQRRDVATGGDWLGFLRVLAESNYSAKAAARRLGLHLNTARYRAARIEGLLGVDLASSDARFDLDLALRILTLRDALKV